MRRIFTQLAAVLVVGCTAETFSPAVADHFEVVQGAGQTGTPGWILDSLVVVRLLDDRGAPIMNADVSWAVTAGSGNITTTSAVTGPDGLAAASWTLGLVPGTQELRVSSSIVPPVTLRAEAEALVLTRIKTGSDLGCGIDEDGITWCWGSNYANQIGAVDPRAQGPVAAGDSSLRFTQLALGDDHGCGLTAPGEVWCWGGYGFGQLGDGRTGGWMSGSATPVRPTGLPPLVAIDAYYQRTCGITAAGVLWCWGSAGGLPTNAVPAVAFPGVSFTQVSLGELHGCGISTGDQVLCWGQNTDGALGNGTIGGSSTTPQPIAAPIAVRRITSGDHGSCAITLGSELYCWGFVGGIDGHYYSDATRGTPSRSIADGAVRNVVLGNVCAAIWHAAGGPTIHCPRWSTDIEALPSINEVEFGYYSICLTVGTGAVYCKSFSDVMDSPLFDFKGRAVPAP